MLGSGHGPKDIVSSMSKNWVINVMTASFSQQRFVEALNKGWVTLENIVLLTDIFVLIAVQNLFQLALELQT